MILTFYKTRQCKKQANKFVPHIEFSEMSIASLVNVMMLAHQPKCSYLHET